MNINTNKYKYKSKIEALISLFYFEKTLNPNIFSNNHYNKYYIIDNSWIKNIKLYFEYEELKKYLNKANENINAAAPGPVETTSLIEDIFNKLPKDYFDKINNNL